MKGSIFLGIVVVLCATLAVVYTTSCDHNNAQSCVNMTCVGDHIMVGCEHGVCTCVNDNTCSSEADCNSMSCHHHEQAQCFDGACRCNHAGP